VSDTQPSSPVEERLRAANARLRQVVEAKDAEIGGLRATVAAHGRSSPLSWRLATND
jgi:hypothetical protein